eukprot:764044-Hanusia_phi.AAC.3
MARAIPWWWAATLAGCVLLLALLSHETQVERKTVLTFWDGAAADEPGYAEEASNQIGTGFFADHVGYWERPGYWNNRAIADNSESKMDDR